MAVEAVELDDERYDLDPADMFDEPTVSIPISFFSILNVTPARASPAAIEAAYAGVINRELVEGFSDGEFILVFVGEIRLTSDVYFTGCLAARADLIDAAAQVLSDPDLRREHEDDVKNGRLTPVPASQLGGALALMQEAGEHESVIEYAPECLAVVSGVKAPGETSRCPPRSRTASSRTTRSPPRPPRVGEGCELLDIASSILVAEAGPGYSRELQETINRTLQEMAPAYVIELLSMPLEATKERTEGLRALRQVLWGAAGAGDDEGALNDKDAYMKEVNRHLAAEEVVDLFLDAPSDAPADVDEIYNAALAHVVCGYVHVRPNLLMDADEMFAQLEDAAWVAANEARDQYATMAVRFIFTFIV